MASGAKTALAEYYMINGTFPISNGEAGLPDAGTISSKYVSLVAVSTDLAEPGIDVVLSGDVHVNLQGGVIQLIPVDNGGSIGFICRSGSRPIGAYLPSNCEIVD